MLEKSKNIHCSTISTAVHDPHNYIHHLNSPLQEYEVAFASSADGKLRLVALQDTLSQHVTPEDTSILRQRLSLLSKQWSELSQQVALRQEGIERRLGQWASFNDKYRSLSDSISKMELKITSSREYHIEDLLQKLKHVCT